MATFHPFPRLPFELRAQIWEATVEPRVVEVRIRHKDKIPRLISPTPVPGPLQTCREARNLKLYRQEFSRLPEDRPQYKGAIERRYVWLNLEIDMVSIEDTLLADFWLVAPMIKRLKFKRKSSWNFPPDKTDDICDFVNLEEVHVVCADGLDLWHGITEDEWPCGIENVHCIDPYNHSMIGAIELDECLTWRSKTPPTMGTPRTIKMI
jgi:hypothetical protein